MRRALLMLAVLGAGSLGACGVPAEDTAREINPPRPFSAASPTPAVAASGSVSERLFLVKDGLLVPVERKVLVEPTVEDLLHDLLAGPTEQERDIGLTSALLGSNVVASIQVTDGEATVVLASDLESGTGRTDDVLAFGQLVCTLGNRPEISRVVFTRDNQRVSIPRGDGSLSEGPLTPLDYAGLIAPG